MPIWEPSEESIGADDLIRNFKLAYEKKWKIGYVPVDKDRIAAQRLKGFFNNESELREFMEYAIEFLGSSDYWKNRVALYAIQHCVNDIRIKIVRDREAERELAEAGISPVVQTAREFWSKVKMDNLHGCARCGGSGYLSWREDYGQKSYSYGAKCSCQDAGGTPHYDDIRTDAKPWHNGDYLFVEDVIVRSGDEPDPADLVTRDQLKEELLVLLGNDGGTYTAAALRIDPMEALAKVRASIQKMGVSV